MSPLNKLRSLTIVSIAGLLQACSAGPKTSVGLYKVDADATSSNTGVGQFTDTSGKAVFVEIPPVIDENCIANTAVQFDPGTGQPVMMFKLKSTCKETLAEFTRNNIGNQMALVIDDKLITVPFINEEISGGSLILSGGF